MWLSFSAAFRRTGAGLWKIFGICCRHRDLGGKLVGVVVDEVVEDELGVIELV